MGKPNGLTFGLPLVNGYTNGRMLRSCPTNRELGVTEISCQGNKECFPVGDVYQYAVARCSAAAPGRKAPALDDCRLGCGQSSAVKIHDCRYLFIVEEF